MIQIKNICKTYTTGTFTQKALDGVSLNFRESEFVAILGPSGSGKTTMLNVLGGLDKYDSGDLVINGRSTKKFKASDWDAYRNNSVGFIFQSYNLIPHLSIIDNVEMGMTLSGVSASKKKQKALDVLERVGLKEHFHKKPSQLSGGQMQRVAIARALANDPDIILADEPTGALDTKTSKEIMELIKEISKDKLVIMVTHNPELANDYVDRIVNFSDGNVKHDSNPLEIEHEEDNYKPKKTSMSFLTALKLSGKNIMTKKGRTILTAFASSIGIIGVALVLALSNGFDKQISSFEKGSLSNFPISINQSAMSIETAAERKKSDEKTKFPRSKSVVVNDPSKSTITHNNVITKDYVDYVNKMDNSWYDGISYTRSVNMNILKKADGKATAVDLASAGFSTYPSKAKGEYSRYFAQYYDILEGTAPKAKTDLVLVVDEYNQLNKSTLKALGFKADEKNINFKDIVGKEYKLIYNDDYYTKSGKYYAVNGTASDLSNLYDSDKAVTLKISAIVRIKSGEKIAALSSGIAYSDELAQNYIDNAKDSAIVKVQKDAEYDVINGSLFADEKASGAANGPAMMNGPMSASMATMKTSSEKTKEEMLSYLGESSIPNSISIYPVNFESKEKITSYLDKWNNKLKDEDRIEYTDMAATITSLSGSIMDGITIVLVAFAAISLIVSMIMVAIIIYISVLERRKEIGILRALGARGKDITRVFNAETFIIGSCSGLLGITLAYLLTFPANAVLYKMTELENVAQLNPVHAVVLVMISIVLTLIGGFIPAKMAAKKDPVEALRSE